MQKSISLSFLKNSLFLIIIGTAFLFLENAIGLSPPWTSPITSFPEGRGSWALPAQSSPEIDDKNVGYLQEIQKYFLASTPSGPGGSFISLKNNDLTKKYCNVDFKNWIDLLRKGRGKNNKRTESELNGLMSNCTEKIYRDLSDLNSKVKKLDLEKDKERFKDIAVLDKNTKTEFDKKWKRLETLKESCKITTSYRPMHDLAALKMKIRNAERCDDLKDAFDSYQKFTDDLISKRGMDCKNRKRNSCVNELDKLVKNYESDTIASEDNLDRRCRVGFINLFNCCEKPSEKNCQTKENNFNEYLKSKSSSGCTDKNGLQNAIYNKQAGICESFISEYEGVCNTKIEEFKKKFRACFYVAKIEDVKRSPTVTECKKSTEEILNQYTKITEESYKATTGDEKTSELNETSDLKDFTNFDKSFHENLKKTLEDNSLFYAEQVCADTSSQNSDSSSQNFVGTGYQTPTSGASDSYDTSSSYSSPYKRDSGSKISPSPYSYAGKDNTNKEISGARNLSPIKNPSSLTGNKPNELPTTMKHTEEQTVGSEDKTTSDSPTGDSSAASASQTGNSTSSQAPNQKDSLKKAGLGSPSLRSRVRTSSRSKSRSRSKRSSGSYLKGFNRSLAFNTSPAATLPIQTYRSRGSETQDFIIGNANQNIFEMISNSMSNFCTTKIKNCYSKN